MAIKASDNITQINEELRDINNNIDKQENVDQLW